eukprot:2148086-Rhodomonas_salina.1
MPPRRHRRRKLCFCVQGRCKLCCFNPHVFAPHASDDVDLHVVVSNMWRGGKITHRITRDVLLMAVVFGWRRQRDGSTALHVAAWGANVAAVQALVAAGCSIDAQDNVLPSGSVSLLLSDWLSFLPLLAFQSLPNLLDSSLPTSSCSPSAPISCLSSIRCPFALPPCPFNPLPLRAQDEHRPLHVAAGKGQEEVVQLLLKGGAAQEAATKVAGS